MGEDENACVRNIVREIMRECAPKKIKVNKNFVTYLTKLLLINPNWGIDDDFFNQRQNVQQFVMYVIGELLTKQDDPKIVTLKIQFYFSCNLEHMDYIIQINRKDLRSRLSILRDDICLVNAVETKEHIDLLYKKIVHYITLISGLGNPLNLKVYEEALVALKSILCEEELIEFNSLSKHDKIVQLTQFCRVVAGIRLFNKDCEKGGEGIANLPDLINKAIDVIREGTQQTLLIIMERVNLLTTAVDRCYVIRHTYEGPKMRYEPTDDLLKANININYIKNMLIFFRQYELLIRSILEQLNRIHKKSEHIFSTMEQILRMIHDTVYMKIAIPVGVVFPLFEQLWEIWEQFQDQSLLLSRLSLIMSNLETYAKQTYYNDPDLDPVISDSPSMTDAERLAETAHLTLESSNMNIKVIKSDTIKNIDNIELQYLGFCCWKLIETDGALIPGNPSMGIVVYRRKNYVFSCIEGFNQFAKDPQGCITCVLNLVRRNPQLINFFQLKDELESVINIIKLVQSKVEIRMCEDKSIQTVANPEESHIDPTYRWNIWDLKREALTTANISSKKTISTQTDKTNSKNSIRIQTYCKKQVEVQTSRETYTNVPKPSVFIYGLRGRKDDQQFKIDLTRPVYE